MEKTYFKYRTKLLADIKVLRPDEDYGDLENFMDQQIAYVFLSKALYNFSKCKNTNQIMNRILNRENEELNCSPIKAAEELDKADTDQIMSDDIFWFLEKAYYDAAQCIDLKYWFSLARIYYYDRYGHVDFEKAVFFLEKAVASVDGRAEVLLGKCYLLGEGVEQNYEKAFQLLLKGALLDYSGEAVYLLGDMYLNGWYVEQDKPQAYQMYLRAHALLADSGGWLEADCMYRLAEYELHEIGTYYDVKSALYYYQRAELVYYDQMTHHIRGAEAGLHRCVQGQAEARAKLMELIEKM